MVELTLKCPKNRLPKSPFNRLHSTDVHWNGQKTKTMKAIIYIYRLCIYIYTHFICFHLWKPHELGKCTFIFFRNL